MGGHRFDLITRLLTREGNRRQMLRALAISAMGGFSLGPRNRAASHEAPAAMCVQDSDCVLPESDPCTGVQCDNGTCSVFIVLCAPGFACCNNGACCPAPAECESDTDCHPPDDNPCSGGHCEGGACAYSIVTCAPGYMCCGNGECCSTWWPDGWTPPVLPHR